MKNSVQNKLINIFNNDQKFKATKLDVNETLLGFSVVGIKA